MTSKTCFKCHETKPLAEFYRHAAMGDGHLNKCKDCTRKDVRQHRIDNPEKVRAYDNERSGLPHRRELRRRIGAAFPLEKKRAHGAVAKALKRGDLERRPCAFCGSTDSLEAHHHDYSKPLDVTWLCVPCHRKFHGLERMATYRAEEAA